MGWIGVDLDGTLAKYPSSRGHYTIGEPIAPMVDRVKAWRADGQDVKIFTARASVPEEIPAIREWVIKHIGEDLPITNAKDFGMIALYDDRCIQVEANTGRLIT